MKKSLKNLNLRKVVNDELASQIASLKTKSEEISLNRKMLFEARFSKAIRKDGWVHCGFDGKAYIIANDFADATRKAIDAFMKWKYIDSKDKENHVLESVTLIDDEPIF